MPQPVAPPLAVSGPLRAEGAWWAYSEGNWMVARGLPVRRGRHCSRVTYVAPSRVNTYVLSAPPGAFGRRGCRVKPRLRVTSGRNKVSG